MFLFMLNKEEGKAFLELSYIAMNINGEQKPCEVAEIENFKDELDLRDYHVKAMSLEQAYDVLKGSTFPVKRCVIIELCSILYADKEINEQELKWIFDLSTTLGIEKNITQRLIDWSKDFSDFVNVGLMFINSK